LLSVFPALSTSNGSSKKQCKAFDYLSDVLSTSDNALDALTWHHYYLDGHVATLQDFLRVDVLDGIEDALNVVTAFVREDLKNEKPLWLGETSSAYGGG
jgi:heparanase 1